MYVQTNRLTNAIKIHFQKFYIEYKLIDENNKYITKQNFCNKNEKKKCSNDI